MITFDVLRGTINVMFLPRRTETRSGDGMVFIQMHAEGEHEMWKLPGKWHNVLSEFVRLSS